MVKCNYCGDELEYLPFRCSYCGKSYCKKHRLPENHECTMEFAHKIMEEKEKRAKHTYVKRVPSGTGIYNVSESNSKQRFGGNFGNRMSSMSGTGWIIIINLVFLILSQFSALTPYIMLSLGNIINFPWLIYTVITTMFIPTINLSGFGFLWLIFHFIFLYFAGRVIEQRHGKGTILKLYFGGALLTSLSIVFFQALFLLIPSYVGLANEPLPASYGGTLALLTFWTMSNPEAQMRFYLYFIPIRMRAKFVLLIFIGFQLIPGIFALFDIISGIPNWTIIYYFSNIIGGLLSGFLSLKSVRSQSSPFRRIK